MTAPSVAAGRFSVDTESCPEGPGAGRKSTGWLGPFATGVTQVAHEPPGRVLVQAGTPPNRKFGHKRACGNGPTEASGAENGASGACHWNMGTGFVPGAPSTNFVTHIHPSGERAAGQELVPSRASAQEPGWMPTMAGMADDDVQTTGTRRESLAQTVSGSSPQPRTRPESSMAAAYAASMDDGTASSPSVRV